MKTVLIVLMSLVSLLFSACTTAQTCRRDSFPREQFMTSLHGQQLR